MPPDETNPMPCRTDTQFNCPLKDCPGRSDPGICSHLKGLVAWRELSDDEQVARLSTEAKAAVDPMIRDAVLSCPDRGSVLPLSLQDDCGCLGRELTECRAMRGITPGRVTLRECLRCRAGETDVLGDAPLEIIS